MFTKFFQLMLITVFFFYLVLPNTSNAQVNIQYGNGNGLNINANIGGGSSGGGLSGGGGGGNSSIWSDKGGTKIVPLCEGASCSLDSGIQQAKGKVNDIAKDTTAANYIQNIISYLLTFLYFVAVVVIIVAGVMILTASGDEEKVSKAKKMIIFAILGMVVIYLAGPLTNFILQMFETART